MAAAKRYDERALGPRELPASWWYSLPHATRVKMTERLGGEAPVGRYIGEIQDALIADGYRPMATRFMVAMQACLENEGPPLLVQDAWLTPEEEAAAALQRGPKHIVVEGYARPGAPTSREEPAG